jgi:hypothetical protein
MVSEVISRVERRRHWPTAEKLRIECKHVVRPGRSSSSLALLRALEAINHVLAKYGKPTVATLAWSVAAPISRRMSLQLLIAVATDAAA